LVYNAANNCVIKSSGASELTVVDVSNPNDCKLLGSLGNRANNLGTWGMALENDKVYATYITTIIPFVGLWSGVKCIEIGK